MRCYKTVRISFDEYAHEELHRQDVAHAETVRLIWEAANWRFLAIRFDRARPPFVARTLLRLREHMFWRWYHHQALFANWDPVLGCLLLAYECENEADAWRACVMGRDPIRAARYPGHVCGRTDDGVYRHRFQRGAT